MYLNTKDELLHGEAIVIGMILESHIALQKKLITKTEFIEIVAVLNLNFKIKKQLLFTSPQLMQLIKNDKKNTNSKLKFALVNKIGGCKVDVDVTESQIQKAITYFKANYK